MPWAPLRPGAPHRSINLTMLSRWLIEINVIETTRAHEREGAEIDRLEGTW